jgi:AraC-like DNA-binding protein
MSGLACRAVATEQRTDVPQAEAWGLQYVMLNLFRIMVAFLFAIVCAVQFVWLLAHEKEPPLLVDVCFAWIVAMAHRGIGRPLSPKRVEFQRAPAHREMYEAHFRCPVKFKANQNALIFSKADIELPFVTYNADLLASVAPQLEAELARQVAEKTFSEQAKGILKQLVAGQCPGVQDLARELHVSTRTLQRRLTEQGISFQRLLGEARRELARHYLLHSSLELNETAYLLGYEDANSFFRTFHHWEGTSPGQWREFQKNSQPATQTHVATPAMRRRASLGFHRTIKGGGL